MDIGDFKINGQLYHAKQIKCGMKSLQSKNTGRTEDGVQHIEWIYHKLRTYVITMPPMQQSDVSQLLNSVHGEYTLTINDPIKGESSYKCYTANSDSDLYSGVIKNGLWHNITFTAIQMDGE